MRKIIMIFKKIALTLALGACVSVQAVEEISYSWFDVGIKHSDVNSVEWQSIYLQGSIELGNLFYLVAGYEDEVAGDNTDISILDIGLGMRTDITDSTDLYGELGYGNVDDRFGDFDYFGVKLGTRTAVNEDFELITGLSYQDPEGNIDERVLFELTGLVKLSDPSNSIRFSVEADDDDLFGIRVGFRKSF